MCPGGEHRTFIGPGWDTYRMNKQQMLVIVPTYSFTFSLRIQINHKVLRYLRCDNAHIKASTVRSGAEL